MRVGQFLSIKVGQKLDIINTNNSKSALYMAISAYNTGNYRAGFSNGYVSRVVKNAQLGYVTNTARKNYP